MSKRTFIIVCITASTAVFGFAADPSKHNYKPKDGYVPDAKTAISIAVAVWIPIYGQRTIAEEKPYRARLESNGVWIVEGSLPRAKPGERVVGGVATAEIAKDDGRVLRVSHGK